MAAFIASLSLALTGVSRALDGPIAGAVACARAAAPLRRPSGRAMLAAGGAMLAACSSGSADVALPAAGTEDIVASARDCAAAVDNKRANLTLLKQRGWGETLSDQDQNFFGMPFVMLMKSDGFPLMTIAENEDGSRVCSLTAKLGLGTSLDDIGEALESVFGTGKSTGNDRYYYREPHLVVLGPSPTSPEDGVQIAIMEPSVQQLMDAGIVNKSTGAIMKPPGMKPPGTQQPGTKQPGAASQ